MRFFFLQDYRQWLLAVSLGLVLAILVYLAFKSYAYSRARMGEKTEHELGYPDGLRGKDSPTPHFFFFLYLGFVIWAIFYVVLIGIEGAPY